MKKSDELKADKKEEENLLCGLVMPISSIDGCDEQHWVDVKGVLTEAIEKAGFKANLVSHADDSGVIQKRIIQNLYDNPIVVCDVSCKNPNVMFELGMRLAFDKPTIIIKDEITNYSFDTSQIEHITYPRDLRFNTIVEFKEKLTRKIKLTFEKANSDPNYTTFLKNFGTFTVAKLETKEVSREEFIIEELRELKQVVNSLKISKGRTFTVDNEGFSRDRKKSINYFSRKLRNSLLELVVDKGTTEEIETARQSYFDSFLSIMENEDLFNNNNEAKKFFDDLFNQNLKLAYEITETKP